MAKVYGGGPKAPATGSSARSSGSSTASAGSTREREQRWTVYALSLLAFSVVGLVLLYPAAAAPGACRSTRPTSATSCRRMSFNTAVSFVTNTNWQSYCPETTMSHLTQMAGLTVQNFVSAAVGHGRRWRADPGARPAPAAHDRQLLGRPHPHARSGSCCRSRSCSRSCWSARASIQNFNGLHEPCTTVDGRRRRRSRRPGRQPGADQAARHQRRRASSTRTRRTRSRTRRPFTNFLEIYAILLIPFALAYTFGRMVKDKRQGCAVFAIMFIIWLAHRRSRNGLRGRTATRTSTRPAPTRRSPPTSRRAGTWRARRSASGRRRPAIWAASHHGHVERLGQLHARQLHAARRHGAARAHEARRGQPGRRRRRA